MKPLHLLTIILLFLQSCGVSRETIRYELPPKQAGDNPAKLQTILAFKTKDAEKLFDKDDFLLEGKVDELKKIAGKESSNPIVLRALAKIDGKLTNLDKAKAIYEKAGLTNNSHYAWVLHDYGDYYNGHNREKTEEYYESSIKIFEALGDKESLAHLLRDSGKFFVKFIEAVKHYVNYEKDSFKVDLLKAKNYLLKEKVILNSDGIRDNPNNKNLQVENLLLLGKTYFMIWQYVSGLQYDNGIPDPKDSSITLPFIDYRNYDDFEIAKTYFIDVLSISKSNNQPEKAMQAAFELANLYSLDSLMSLDSYTGSNGSLERVYISLGDSYQKSYKNLEKAYEYYIDATILAEKGNNITNAIEYFHKALEVLSQNRKDENLNILATKVFEKVEKKLLEFPKNENLKVKYISTKIKYGETYIEEKRTEREVNEYYTKLIEDKKFDLDFFKRNGNSNNPRQRLKEYNAKNRNFCEAAKWGKANIDYAQSNSKEKQDTKELERYTRKCNILKGNENKSFDNKAIIELNDLLLNAVLTNDLAKVKDLILNGASINAELDQEAISKTGQNYSIDATAVMLASGEGLKDIVLYLIQKGASLNSLDSKEYTALHYATFGNQKEIVKILVENNANVNVGSYSPLMLACDNNFYAIAKILIDNKANVNAVNPKFGTPMTYAIYKQNFEIIDLLVKNKANINIKNNFGKTAIGFAKRYNYTKIVEYLLSQGGKE
jgi:ankyrin repeat protein